MDGIYLEIPEEMLANALVPLPHLKTELLRRVVAAMYAEDVVGGSAPCMLAGPGKSEFHDWLGECSRVKPLGTLDYELERRNLDEWLSDD
jgi:hypothetical protein